MTVAVKEPTSIWPDRPFWEAGSYSNPVLRRGDPNIFWPGQNSGRQLATPAFGMIAEMNPVNFIAGSFHEAYSRQISLSMATMATMAN
jgi:hypothetical protein